MEGPTVIIYVAGGLVQAVACDEPAARILVVDADGREDPENRMEASWPWHISLPALREYHREVYDAATAEMEADAQGATPPAH